MLGIADEALAVDHEAGVEPADPADAADHLLADLGHDLPEQRLIDEPREHLVRVVRLAVIARDDRRRARRSANRGSIGAEVAAVEVGAARRQARDVAADAREQRVVVGNADVGAAR